MKRFASWIKDHQEVVFISLLALFLRLISINQSLWLDEATTALVARNSLAHYFTSVAPADFHPPLHYLITRLFTHLFAPTDFVVRLPSLLVGVFTVAVVYQIAKDRISKQAAAFAGLLMATAPLHIYYSQEARMYTLAAFFVALAVHFFQNKKFPAYYCILSLSAAYLTHYLTLLMVPVFFLSAKNKRKTLNHLLLSLLPFLLWMPVLLQQVTTATQELNPAWASLLGYPTLKNAVLIPVKFIIGRISFSPDWLYTLIVIIAANLYGWTILMHKKLFKEHRLFILWLGLPPLLLIAISFVAPMLSYFRLLFILPGLYLLAAAGLDTVRSKIKQGVLLLALLSVNFYSAQMYLVNDEFQRPPWKQAISRLEQANMDNPLVIFTYPQTPEPYRWYEGALPALALTGTEADLVLLNQLAHQRTIIYFEYANDIYDPDQTVLNWLKARGFEELGFWQYPGLGKIRFLSQNQIFAQL